MAAVLSDHVAYHQRHVKSGQEGRDCPHSGERAGERALLSSPGLPCPDPGAGSSVSCCLVARLTRARGRDDRLRRAASSAGPVLGCVLTVSRSVGARGESHGNRRNTGLRLCVISDPPRKRETRARGKSRPSVSLHLMQPRGPRAIESSSGSDVAE